jgi:hypothetical protein
MSLKSWSDCPRPGQLQSVTLSPLWPQASHTGRRDQENSLLVAQSLHPKPTCKCRECGSEVREGLRVCSLRGVPNPTRRPSKAAWELGLLRQPTAHQVPIEAGLNRRAHDRLRDLPPP